MLKAPMFAALLAIAGCAAPPAAVTRHDPCAGNEGAYACQVLRYHNTQ